jgi:hypothetical protein
MIKTPVDLYRRGNATSPRMDHVRPNKDIAIYENKVLPNLPCKIN